MKAKEGERMTHLSLFSGIGGLDLAAEWAGFETVGQCEMADYPTKILEKHWPDVARWRDIRTLTKEDFFARTGLRTVDIISGGFPCQPFSVAGKQKGREDDRYLWPEMRRVIAELEPRWVVGENVPGILRIAAKDVIEDLESMGYHVLLLDFEAAAVGAFHRRERIAFVANRDGMRKQPAGPKAGTGLAIAVRMWPTPIAGNCGMTAKTGGRSIEKSTKLQTQVMLEERKRLIPTVKASDYKGSGPAGSRSAEHDLKRGNLKGFVMYATPQARDYRSGQIERWEDNAVSRNLNDQCGGQLNPTWVEWLMGFPIGWTELKD